MSEATPLLLQETNVFGTQPFLAQMSNREALLTGLVMLGAERATRTTAEWNSPRKM
ncbi:hypothetical protein [Reticulibacter mediterranei]|uniref:hypothetical protein n=1 Tax=Reticulibacter mediterranei TaxID=2778369 RepID=UPI001C692835|nr:hypothetical protein [Reticulibacter mediterranei]